MNEGKRRLTNNETARRGKRFWALAALVASVVWLAACGEPGPGGNPGVGTVASVSIDQGDVTLGFGLTRQLSATVDASGGASTAVDWSSSNEGVATVSDSGLVTAGDAAGTATITATSRSDRTKSDSITVTVQEGGGGGGPGDPTAPTLTFTAAPDSIATGETATLTWSIDGDFTSAEITDTIGDTVSDGLAATGTVDVTPDMSESYTLTVHYGTSSLVTATAIVNVQAAEGAPTITGFAAEVLRGSQIRFTWTGNDALAWELFAVGTGDASVDLASGPGNGGDVTVDIPSSATPSYRLVLSNALGEQPAQMSRPANVVVDAGDYDPYDGAGSTPEPAEPGTLRSVLANAAPNTVIGFASDISTVVLPGVGFYRGGDVPNADAHLIVDKNIVISGPDDGRVTLQGSSNYPAGHPSEELTWHSRMVYVAPSANAELENLVITGGDFIVSGAGIYNLGTLTIRNVAVTDNKAFADGGGIRNSGTLTIIDSEITNNRAFTTDEEVGKIWIIRGSDDPNARLDYGADPMGNGGGIMNRSGGTVTITNSVISGNETYFSGGGIYNSGTVNADGTDVTGNVASFTSFTNIPEGFEAWSYGGGIMNEAALTFTGGSIDSNQSAQQGGGLWHGADATSTLTGVGSIEGNTAGLGDETGYGGGIMERYFAGATPSLDTLAPATYGTGNVPENYLSSEVAPAAAGTTLHPLDYRMDAPATR